MKEQPVETRILEAGSVDESRLTYVVIGAWYRDKWIFVRHRDRSTWEMPAGHIEKGEPAGMAAERELFEEAGVTGSVMEHHCDYEVTVGGKTEYGRLYSADVKEINTRLEYETEEILLLDSLPTELTYQEVQTVLFNRLKQYRLENER
jgi:8-oxo-dGTP diphosphatase